MLTHSTHSLPRKLKRPYFTFFYAMTFIFGLALIASAIASLLSASSGPIALTGLIGGSIWLGFAIGALFNWQSVTVFQDYLVFNSFSRKTKVFYKEISRVEAFTSASDSQGIFMSTLYLHRGATQNPLALNMQLIGKRERVFLLELIKSNAPSAHFNALAEKVRRGL